VLAGGHRGSALEALSLRVRIIGFRRFGFLSGNLSRRFLAHRIEFEEPSVCENVMLLEVQLVWSASGKPISVKEFRAVPRISVTTHAVWLSPLTRFA
jgi:hypothetical protein